MYSVFVDSNGIIYAGSDGNGLYISTDGGDTFFNKNKQNTNGLGDNAIYSIFVDSDIENLSDILNPDISAIEIFTGPYAIAMASDDNKRIDQELKKIATLATSAQKLGLKVNAGHDLTTDNLKNLVELNLIDEVSIGHAIITQSLEYGYEQTLDKYLEIING